MCNEAIRVVVASNPKNRFELISLAYPKLKQYGLHTHYILSACEVAYSLCRNQKRRKVPVVRRAFLKLDSQSYRLNHLLLRIPSTSRQYVFLTLDGSDHSLLYVENPNLKRGSVTVTPEAVCIAFSKEVTLPDPVGYVGIDVNERNITVSATDGHERRFTELGEIVDLKKRYREIRARIERRVDRDARVRKRLLAKFGRRERNRTVQRLHAFTRQVVNYAKVHDFGIKMENLTGIRQKHRKGNGKGPRFRGRMNSWVFGEAQRQVEYKARWDGVPVWYVNPKSTSQNCPTCGSLVAPLTGRKLFCTSCDNTWDRDVLASRNIMACAVPQARPSRGSGEGGQGDDGFHPRSRWREARSVGDDSPTTMQNHSISTRRGAS